MKPYGSKRSYDTEPRIKSGRALVKREGKQEVEVAVYMSDSEDEIYWPGGSVKRPKLYCKVCGDILPKYSLDRYSDDLCGNYCAGWCDGAEALAAIILMAEAIRAREEYGLLEVATRYLDGDMAFVIKVGNDVW